jgi:hypothetical protein
MQDRVWNERRAGSGVPKGADDRLGDGFRASYEIEAIADVPREM